MSTSRRSFIAGSLGALALGLAGCASDAPKGGASQGPSGGGTAVPPKDISGDLLVWDWAAEDLAKINDAAFTKLYPNVKVTHIDQPSKDYATLLQAALSANKGPDVFTLHAGTELVQFAPALLDLTDRITADQKKNLLSWDLMSPDFDGAKGTFGLPFQLNGTVFYYNTKLFTQAGLDPAKPPASWPELIAAADKLKAANIVPFMAGDAENVQAQVWFGTLSGMELTVEETEDLSFGRLKYNSPKVKDLFQKYLTLATGGYFEKSWRSDGIFTQQVDGFSTGKAAMTMTLSNYIGIFNDALKGDMGTFLTPALTEGGKPNYLPFSAGQGVCVSKRSKNPDAAYAWASFLTGDANQQIDLNELSTTNKLQRGSLPTSLVVKPNDSTLPSVKQLVDTLQSNVTHPPPASQKAAVGTALIQGFGSVVDGRKSLDTFLDDLDKAQAG